MTRTAVFLFLLAAGAAQGQTPAPLPAELPGVLRVESDPPRAVVLVDSVRIGPTPVEVPVDAGLRRVRVLYVGYEPIERSVTVRPGEVSRVAVTLVRRTGLLTFSNLPAGATVLVNGAPASGVTAAPTGDVRVRVEVPGQRPLESVFRVEAQSETTVEYAPRVLDGQALTFALFAPGFAQASGGRPLVAAAVLAGLGAGVGVAVAGRASERGARQRVDVALGVYTLARTEGEVVAARADVDRHFADVRSARRRQTVALGAAAAVYGASVADAFVRHVLRPGLRASFVRPPDVGVSGRGLRLAFAL